MIKALIIYIQFFSRIVIPKAVDISYLRRGLPFLTLFGLLLGLISEPAKSMVCTCPLKEKQAEGCLEGSVG